MNLNKHALLEILEESGGTTTEHPFIETGNLTLLEDLIDDGFLIRLTRNGDLDEIQITELGKAFLASQAKHPSGE